MPPPLCSLVSISTDPSEGLGAAGRVCLGNWGDSALPTKDPGVQAPSLGTTAFPRLLGKLTRLGDVGKVDTQPPSLGCDDGGSCFLLQGSLRTELPTHLVWNQEDTGVDL